MAAAPPAPSLAEVSAAAPPPPPTLAPTPVEVETHNISLSVKDAASAAARGPIKLSPFDTWAMGRPIPMIWFYPATVGTEALLEALQKTLAHE